MRCRRPNACAVLAAIAAASICLPGPAEAAKALEDRDWIEVTTPHFTIRSTLGKRKTVDMAKHAELLRAAVLRLTASESVDSPIKTIVYALPGKYFVRLVEEEDIAGIYLADARQNIILVRDTRRMDESSIIKHEYVHDLTRGLSGADFPKWYIEGIAAYFESSEIVSGRFRVGVPNSSHTYILTRLGWVDADEWLESGAFTSLKGDEIHMFYAQSWLLIHYLMHNDDRPVSMHDAFQSYAAERKAGKNELDSFATAFQMDTSAMRHTLLRYMRHECCQYLWVETDLLLPEFEPQVADLSRADISLGLGQVALKLDSMDLASDWLDIAAENEGTRPRALAFSVPIVARDSNSTLAEDRLDEALLLAPDDPYLHVERAEYKIWRVGQVEDQAERESLVKEAQSSLVKAWRLDKNIPVVYALSGQTYLMLKNNPDRAVEMLEQAVVMAPSDLKFRYYLALAYARAGRSEDARPLARSLLNWSHGASNLKDNAQALIDSLETQDAADSGAN
jgi:tetratricopeptide (TPR) repeat protein